jgi:beta-galactosidase GanA
VVDGRPFLILGGELGNSCAAREFLAPYWPKFTALGLNTLLAPVAWDAVEPHEGTFDFQGVDELIDDASAHGIHLVLLWFGSWKNSMSCYAPAWVKTNLQRFRRCRSSAGEPLEILTPFSPANRDADACAFAALMRHIAQYDDRHTVVMVQVENEIGMIPEARDYSPEANAVFAGPVPAELIAALGASDLRHAGTAPTPQAAPAAGTWTDVFGPGPATEEIFMAWAFARYTGAVVAAGKAELALPMYTNAALIRPGRTPGQYPSGGPLPHLATVWRAGAPAVDFLAPDIYFPAFAQWADAYVQAGNPLFVPEALRSIDAAANALYAFGAHRAIGFAPFGIESIDEPARTYLAGAYDVVRQLAGVIMTTRGNDMRGDDMRGNDMLGLIPPCDEASFAAPITMDVPTDAVDTRTVTAGSPSIATDVPVEGNPGATTSDRAAGHRAHLGDLDLAVTYERNPAPSLADGVINEAGDRPRTVAPLPAGAIVIRTGPDELVIAGIGVTITFSADDGSHVGILSCEEGRYQDGAWRRLRRLGGDQTHQGRHIRLEPGRFVIQRARLYRYR